MKTALAVVAATLALCAYGLSEMPPPHRERWLVVYDLTVTTTDPLLVKTTWAPKREIKDESLDHEIRSNSWNLHR